MNTIGLSFLFDNLKDGDCLFFYHTQWWAIFSKIIRLFTGEKMDHVGICLEVKRDENSCRFMFGEQTYKHGGCYRLFSIEKKGENYLLRGFNATNLFYGQLKESCKKYKINRMVFDQENQIGKKYGVSELPKTINAIYRLLPKTITKTGLDTLRVCSTNVAICWYKGFVISLNQFNSDKYRSPAELSKMNHINVFKVTDYTNF